MSAKGVRYWRKADIVTSSRLVDHLVSCVVNYDGRLEILKLWLASKGGLDSFLKFRPMPQLRGLDAFSVVNRAAPTRFFIKQECFTDQIWISPPTRYRKAILRNSFFAAQILLRKMIVVKRYAKAFEGRVVQGAGATASELARMSARIAAR
jgi:hypothetical protein